MAPDRSPEHTLELDETMKLDRTSAVPLYHQLQEVLKEQIESGLWQPGLALASEPELAERFGVSRVVVRMALAILEDDRQIVRIRGRGTFIAKPKLNYRACGLSRLLSNARGANGDIGIRVLDRRITPAERTVRETLGAPASERLLRITSLVRLRGVPLAIGYSYFRRKEVPWLDAYAIPEAELPNEEDLSPEAHGIELEHSEVAIESTTSGHFDADHFNLPDRSPAFLVSLIEYRRAKSEAIPFEVARFGYRSDVLQFRLQVPSDSEVGMQATWAFTDPAWPPSPPGDELS
jgi:GntR family transcriptional regulator